MTQVCTMETSTVRNERERYHRFCTSDFKHNADIYYKIVLKFGKQHLFRKKWLSRVFKDKFDNGKYQVSSFQIVTDSMDFT
jgi:hypothetical protein